MEEKTSKKDVRDKNKENKLFLSKAGVFISEENRFSNTLVLGKKKSGKSNDLLTSFAKQDLEKKDCGITFVVSKKNLTYTLYAMARAAGRAKKDIIILKPSANFKVADELIWMEDYSYDEIAKFIDYKEVIKKKKIVIIDMEYSQFRDYSIRATAMLLTQLQIDMQETQKTLSRKHYVYIDDACSYLPFIELLLESGEEYNIGTTLFMQSREEIRSIGEQYVNLVDNNTRNLILTNAINTADAEYYRKSFISSKLIPYEDVEKMRTNLKDNPNLVDTIETRGGLVVYGYYSMYTMLCRKAGTIIYETIGANGARMFSTCQVSVLTSEYKDKIVKAAQKARREFTNEVRSERRISQRESESFDAFSNSKEKKLSIENEIQEKLIKSNDKENSISDIFNTKAKANIENGSQCQSESLEQDADKTKVLDDKKHSENKDIQSLNEDVLTEIDMQENSGEEPLSDSIEKSLDEILPDEGNELSDIDMGDDFADIDFEEIEQIDDIDELETSGILEEVEKEVQDAAKNREDNGAEDEDTFFIGSYEKPQRQHRTGYDEIGLITNFRPKRKIPKTAAGANEQFLNNQFRNS